MIVNDKTYCNSVSSGGVINSVNRFRNVSIAANVYLKLANISTKSYWHTRSIKAVAAKLLRKGTFYFF